MANLTLYHVSACVEPGTRKPCFYRARWSVYYYYFFFWCAHYFWNVEDCEVLIKGKKPPEISLKPQLNVPFKAFLKSWCRCISCSFQILSRQVRQSFRTTPQQLGRLVNPEGATTNLVQDFPPPTTPPKRNICSLACCSFPWQDSSRSSNAELGNSSAGVWALEQTKWFAGAFVCRELSLLCAYW